MAHFKSINRVSTSHIRRSRQESITDALAAVLEAEFRFMQTDGVPTLEDVLNGARLPPTVRKARVSDVEVYKQAVRGDLDEYKRYKSNRRNLIQHG